MLKARDHVHKRAEQILQQGDKAQQDGTQDHGQQVAHRDGKAAHHRIDLAAQADQHIFKQETDAVQEITHRIIDPEGDHALLYAGLLCTAFSLMFCLRRVQNK